MSNLNVFLTLSCYNINNVTSSWAIASKKVDNEFLSHNTGLGNMLFQIASGLSYAIKNNATLHVPCLNTYFQVENLNKEETIFRNINTGLIGGYNENKLVGCSYDHRKFNIHNIKFYNNINLSGYFENMYNFHEIHKIIIEFFKPTQKDIDYLLNKYEILKKKDNLSSIHIRRGKDYEKIYTPNKLDEFDNNTYKLLNHMICKKNITNFFVLTNDKPHCKKILDNNPKYKNINFYYSNERDFFDCWIISLIKNNINSFSTLSWWGAYLNQNKDKYIIYIKNTHRGQLNNPGWKSI